jgi:hypothetical protein
MEKIENNSASSVSEEPCLSALYLHLENSISCIESDPHQALDTLTLLMEEICSKQEEIMSTTLESMRLEFWDQVNSTWIFVITSILKSKSLGFQVLFC